MIIQACINGARPQEFHAHLPLTAEAMLRDVQACLAAGASEIHLHPRSAPDRESLAAVSATTALLRKACPGTLFGVSTGAWIENDVAATRALIAAWTDVPDYASVNLSEPDAFAVMDLLLEKGVGIEAGLASAADAKLLLAYPQAHKILRFLIEIGEQNLEEAIQVCRATEAVLDAGPLRKSILLHGFDATVWPFVDEACARGFSTRVGLEDGKLLPDGTEATHNAALVAEAVAIYRHKDRKQVELG
ncbi:3-keto-5-aminohexanoate cleavage protein [Aestuariivirga litoralis]|uniref:3-keto-5-aminohexanoate cleavage protein n=1 Tax=Aestuariivirga litoralis TaxID=2650924 RepID=UPI0018C73BDD|nr:3-keto-5-aminohexanoate cleavage protein [Aestuariivirga litoralis]MBG1232755.1 3-keto-5-aminohexanoate cleavage protein [Aestuariivirga litoralis]